MHTAGRLRVSSKWEILFEEFGLKLVLDGITQIRGSIPPWKILFLIEGLPTCAFAVVAWYFLPDGITTAKFLTEREKQVALHFVARNQRLDIGKEQGLRFKEVLEGFQDPKGWIPAIVSITAILLGTCNES